MELLLTDEQTMLRDSAAAYAARHGGADRLRTLRGSDRKIDPAVWSEAAEAGFLAVLAPEDAGGLALGLTELCLLSQELGRGLVPEPVAAAAAVARTLASGEDSEAAGAAVTGEIIVLPALMEGPRAIGDEKPAAEIAGNGDALTLDGTKTGLINPNDGTGFLVSASTSDGTVLVHTARDGATIETAELMDGTASGSVVFSAAPAQLVGGANTAAPATGALLDALHLANAAELLGVMEAAQEMTVEYLKVREQFDRPIGSFQALQHRAVDNLTAIEKCRSLIYQAARAIDSGGGAPGLPSAALSLAADSALDICKSAVQLHGGIGFTDEHDIGLYLKRAMVLSARYGNAGLHRQRYAALAGAHERASVA